tara:strand:+ start:361 stop:765 length:405 start_codon:yes stop_codon:yes gene_type:complete
MFKLSFLNRFLLSVSLLGIGIVKGYSQNDFDKPVLSSFSVSPSNVDISSEVVTLTITVNASDASGVITPSQGAYTYYNNLQYTGTTWTLTSGDVFDGVYTSYLALDPTEIGPGSLTINERAWSFKDPNNYEAIT